MGHAVPRAWPLGGPTSLGEHALILPLSNPGHTPPLQGGQSHLPRWTGPPCGQGWWPAQPRPGPGLFRSLINTVRVGELQNAAGQESGGPDSPLHSCVEEVQERRAVLAPIEAHAELVEAVPSQGGLNGPQGACYLFPERRPCQAGREEAIRWAHMAIQGPWGPPRCPCFQPFSISPESPGSSPDFFLLSTRPAPRTARPQPTAVSSYTPAASLQALSHTGSSCPAPGPAESSHHSASMAEASPSSLTPHALSCLPFL